MRDLAPTIPLWREGGSEMGFRQFARLLANSDGTYVGPSSRDKANIVSPFPGPQGPILAKKLAGSPISDRGGIRWRGWLPTYSLPTYLSTYLPTYLPTYRPPYLRSYLTYLPSYAPTYDLPTHLPTYTHT